MRNSALIGIFGVASLGFAFLSTAGTFCDTDGDGVGYCASLGGSDNCLVIANGPLASTGACDDQEDGDMDGYGNPCDTDYNNNGATDLVDVFNVFLKAQAVSTDNTFDNNCNGAADLVDVNQAFNDQIVVLVPGPSGHACAGSIPCP